MGLAIWRYRFRRHIRNPLVRAGEALLCAVGLHAWSKDRTYCVRFWCWRFPRVERVCHVPEAPACDHDVQPVNEDWGRCVKCGEDDFPLTHRAAYGEGSCGACGGTESVAVFVPERPHAMAQGPCPRCVAGHRWGVAAEDGIRTCGRAACGMMVQQDEDGICWHAAPKDEPRLGYGWISISTKPLPTCPSAQPPRKKWWPWA